MEFITLDTSYLDDIYLLLVDHNTEGDISIVRKIYSKDYIYWYLRYIPYGYVIGLKYNNKLIGVITSTFISTVINGEHVTMPYVNLLCVQTKLRNLGLETMLVNEMMTRLNNQNVLIRNYHLDTTSIVFKGYVIPINLPKLKEIGFLEEDDDISHSIINSNPLHLLKESDLPQLIPKLNACMKKFDIYHYFDNDSARHFFLPKKKIVYSFVNYDQNNQLTDFISVYVYYLHSVQNNKIITVAQLGLYFYESMTLTELVALLIHKLKSYDIDQLVFWDCADNQTINLTKFETDDEDHYCFMNGSNQIPINDKICLLTM